MNDACRQLLSQLTNAGSKQHSSPPSNWLKTSASTKSNYSTNNNNTSCSLSSPPKPANAAVVSNNNNTNKHESSAKRVARNNKSQSKNVISSEKFYTNGTVNNHELKYLKNWDDEDADKSDLDESIFKELADSDNGNGWKADEMFEYNEKMHKIHTTYNEKTLSTNYTTPLPKSNCKVSRNRHKLAEKLAEQIQLETNGRVTPESSDDDEVYELERLKRKQHQHNSSSQSRRQISNHDCQDRFKPDSELKRNKSSSRHSTSTETPATISLSSSPTLNEAIRPITSSSRNILRTCLGMTTY